MLRFLRPALECARCAALCAAACALASAAADGAAQELTIAVSRSSLSLPIYVAETLDYFKAEGVAVRTRECLGGHRCIKQMLDGEVSLATSSEMPVMVNSLERADFAIVATFATSKRDVKLVARRSAGIAAPGDLAGKRVATMAGTSAHYFLDLYLLFNGVDPRSVAVVPLAPEQIVAAVQQGTVDATATFEPFAHRAMLALAQDGIVLPGARIYTETFNLSARRTLIAEREGDLVKLMRALARAQRFIREQPRQAQAILRDRMREDQGYIDATWKDFDYRMSLDQPLISTLEGQARWALREGHLPAGSRVPNFLHFVAPEPLRKAEPAAVTLVK
ncbi:MAG: ABC transporter substrate-binding protein [Burkholderiaceae bacterium]|nr:ABC transporter substrate-binding protein [Burkholderiaceae bacterium]